MNIASIHTFMVATMLQICAYDGRFYTITAWCSCKKCTSSWSGGPTASGVMPQANRTVAAPRSFPFGTRVIIGGKQYAVEDRTSPRYEGRFDIYMETHQEALEFGNQAMKVWVVK